MAGNRNPAYDDVMNQRLLAVMLSTMPLFTSVASVRSAETVTLAVSFQLTDLERKPIANAPARVACGPERVWQAASAGRRFKTNQNGECHFECPVRIEQRAIKRPTNFVDSLLSRPEPTDHLQVATELDYAGHRWLYVIDLHHFRRDGTVMLNGFSVFTRDAQGNFTVPAKRSAAGWAIADLPGVMLTHPGHEVSDFTLVPSEDESDPPRWSLTLAFKRSPAPVWR
jgi:hypothetical protein